MIRLNGISKSYVLDGRKHAIFEDVTIDIPSDRRIAVLGARGSGKSTLLRLLAGIERPESGTIERLASVSLPVGYGKGFKPALSPRQNATFFADCYGADAGEVVSFVQQVSGLGSSFERPMNSLPGEARLEFAFALGYAIPFDVYLIDNTPAAGRPAFRDLCMAMYEQRASTAGILFATSEPRIAQRYCEMALVISARKLTLYDDLVEAFSEFLSSNGVG